MNVYDPIVDFLRALEHEGFEISIDAYLKTTMILKKLPPGSSREAICDYLCPLIVKNRAEQESFREAFAKHAWLLGLEEQAPPAVISPVLKAEKKESIQKDVPIPPRWPYLSIGILFALLLGYGGYQLYLYLNPPAVQGCMDIRADNYNPQAVVDCKCCQYSDEAQINQGVIGCRDTTAVNYKAEATIDCEGCCQYEGCRDPKAINYNPKASIDCADCCEYASIPTLTTLAQRDSISYQPFFVQKTVKKPELQSTTATFRAWIAEYKKPLNWALYGVLLALSVSNFFWRRARRKYIARKERGDDPPYRLPIKIQRDRPILVKQNFYLALNRLRGRENSPRNRLNVLRTIDATVRKGGQINFQYDALTQPVEYVILIDKNTEQNHQSQLFEYMYRRFLQHEVHVDRYFFDGNPQICWNRRHPAGVSLDRLLQLHSRARLLVLSEGYSFINSATGKLEDWVRQLQSWENRALLTPAPIGGWNYREATLATFFVVLPSNIRGLLEVVDQFEQLPSPSLREWKYKLGRHDKPFVIDEDQPLPALQTHFEPTMLRWITACAVYPELHWDLTLELGYVLSPPDKTLVSFPNIAQLARLTWFRQGFMPDKVRTKLLQNPDFKEADRIVAHQAIIRVLENNIPENKESYAYEEHQMYLAVSKLMVGKMPREKQKWMEVFRRQHGKGVQEDYVAAAQLDQRYNQLLDFKLPKRFWHTFYPQGRRVLGAYNWAPLALAGALAFLIWILLRLLPVDCSGERVSLPFSKGYYCLKTAEDSIQFYTLSALQYVDSLRLEELAELNRNVESWRIQDQIRERVSPNLVDQYQLAYKTYFQNVYAAHFNRALSFYKEGSFENASKLLENVEISAPLLSIIAEWEGANLSWADTVLQHNLDLLHLRGLTQFFRKDPASAATDAREIQTVAPDYFNRRPPNLQTLLDYDFVDSISNGRIRVRRDGKYSFLDRSGRLVGDSLFFDHAFSYESDSALVARSGRQCYIDTLGVERRCFNQLTPFQALSPPRLWGYQNEQGYAIIPPRYEEAYNFSNEQVARVKRNGRYGFIHLNALPINGFTYENARDFQYGLAAVARNGRWGYIDASGRFHLPTQYQRAYSFNDNGRARVRKNNRNFTIDRNGNCIGGNCPTIIVSGQVVDGLSGAPIPQVQISGRNIKTLADNQGRYRLEIPEDLRGTGLALQFQKAGYETRNTTLDIVVANKRIQLSARIAAELDDDQDGVLNAQDNCPTDPGPARTKGCPDADNDGVANVDDLCPFRPGTPSTRGCPDADKDGVIDKEDSCPTEPGLPDWKGCPEPKVILPEMIRVEAGIFTMGCVNARDGNCESDETPAHQIRVQSFSIGKFEVSNAEFAVFLNLKGNQKEGGVLWYEISSAKADIRSINGWYAPKEGLAGRPAMEVSWYGARAYANWLSEQTGENYRLPTEAEWEYAARGGLDGLNNNYRYAGANDLKKVGWYKGNADGRAHSNNETIEALKPNDLKIYNMSGNVWEWCEDWYDRNYYQQLTEPISINPPGAGGGISKVARGGAYSSVGECRVADREGFNPNARYHLIGFRLAK